MNNKEVLYSYFLFWGKKSESRYGGYVYDNKDMTLSSVYGPNGIYSKENENEKEFQSDYYGQDYNFNDFDW